MVDMGFRKKVVRKSEAHSSDDTTIVITEVNGEQMLEVTTSKPRQYIKVPMYLVEAAVEDLWSYDASDAMARRKEQND